MSTIDAYFSKKSTTKRSKKRKLEEIEDGNKETTDNQEPAAKRIKLTNTDQDVKEQSIDDNKNDDNDDNDNITYSTCHKLLDKSWSEILSSEFDRPYYKILCSKLQKDQNSGIEIFPPLNMVFRAFEICPWNKLKVVILGQDPYHDDNQAEGLCFSVQKGVKIPSSLRNMYKEAITDVQFKDPGHGSLIDWGKQGVLLLNTVLTVQAHKANSHKKYGWQTFTDNVIKTISNKHDCVVFILWGGQARKKIKIINTSKHKIIESVHPSGLSAHRGFIGSKPYSKCNAFLKELGKDEINWQISS